MEIRIKYLQPEGLVVSPAALVDSQVVLDRAQLARIQQEFLPFATDADVDDKTFKVLRSLPDFLCDFLGWSRESLLGRSANVPIPGKLLVDLPEFGETLRPDFALCDAKPADPERPWLMLIKELPIATPLDDAHTGHDQQWSASAARRFERLLRETRVPIGLLSNRTAVRLIYAPHGENSGSLTFPIGAMCEVAGRPIVGALHLLLNRFRLFAAGSEERLPALLRKSREYQRRGFEMRLIIRGSRARAPLVDLALIKAITRGRQWADDLLAGRVESVAHGRHRLVNHLVRPHSFPSPAQTVAPNWPTEILAAVRGSSAAQGLSPLPQVCK